MTEKMSVKYSCQIVASLLQVHGVKHVVMSPGSRNAPLIMAMKNRSGICTHNVIDERVAAFIALGMAQVSGEPVALICTSGTALLNYAPAVAEAYYQHLPLIVISADRPRQWIDQDDSQTIRQPGALDNFVRYSCDLPDFEDPNGEMSWYAGRCMNDAMLAAVAPPYGPVHVNVQLSEPLTAEFPVMPDIRIVTELHGDHTLCGAEVCKLAEMAKGRKIMVVAGFMAPSQVMTEGINELACLPNVTVLADNIANLHCDRAINMVDRVLSLVKHDDVVLQPQIVISMGGALVSRNLKSYLRNCTGLEHWSVGLTDTSADVFRHLTKRIKSIPDIFIHAFADALKQEHPSDGYNAVWQNVSEMATLRHNFKLSATPWSTLKAFSIIWPAIPENTNVQLSNGTCVRYAQLFYNPEIHAVYGNRGVSGIDGSTSTAAGASVLYPNTTLLITGDMSFAYDLGALSTFAVERLKIVVINNRGGGIFRFIKSTRNIPGLEQDFCVDPKLDLCSIAKSFGLEFFRVSCEDELRSALPAFFRQTSKSIMEIVVDSVTDAQALIDYFK